MDSNDSNRKIVTPGFKQLRPVDLIDRISVACRKSSQERVAADIGISRRALSDILKGKTEINADVARRLGFERVVTYVRWKNQDGA